MRTPLLAIVLFAAACGGAPAAPAVAPPPAAPSLPTDSATTATPAPTTGASKPVTSGTEVVIPPAIRAAVDAADRDPADTKLDAGRHPAETLAFFGIAPGMKVGEIVAGTGYTTELLARTVGASGVVYGENPKFLLEKFAQKPWSARLAKPVMKNVKRVDAELEAPFPAEAKDLDAVIDVLFYHDTYWMKADRDKMNKAIFAALKPGGVYGIVDHSGRPGTGSTEVQSLHRIEQKLVVEEIEKAGFKLAAEATFMRNADDKRDWNASPMSAGEKRGTSDRFVLKFVKP